MKKNVFRLKAGLPLMLTLIAGQLQASVTITEVMQSNFGGVIDYYNEFPDSWVELYNDDSIPVNLQGYRISVKNKFDSAYVLSDSVRIDINGYYLVYCDKEGKGRHTDFRLNTDKPGTVYLWDKNKVLVDSLLLKESSTTSMTNTLSFFFVFRRPLPICWRYSTLDKVGRAITRIPSSG